MYEKPETILGFVLDARDAVLRRLARPNQTLHHAWIITSEGERAKLEAMANRLQAELVVLDVSAMECLRRITQDPRRAGKWELWQPIVDRWWKEYR